MMTVGQWIGRFNERSGETERALGECFLNVDSDRPFFGRVALKRESEPDPVTWSEVRFRGDPVPTAATVVLSDPNGLPPRSTVELSLESDLRTGVLRGTWKSESASGTFELFNASKKSIAPASNSARVMTWAEFKALAESNVGRQIIYRGQRERDWHLRTSLHRTGRADLVRYAQEDVHRLNRYLTAVVGKPFDVTSAMEHGAMLSLAQHHGFPTPLLDWTESPYIAAFFAFHELSKQSALEGFVRIFSFDRAQWAYAGNHGVSDMTYAAPYFSIHEFLPMLNDRAIPQQSVVTSTNVVDIEHWLESRQPPHLTFLSRYDIAQSERATAMAELASMGITSASLFPGVDGTCKALKERYF